MEKTNVVEMATIRELLGELDKIRADILKGDIQGWGGVVRRTDGKDVVYIGGSFKTSSADRTRAMLRVSAVLAMKEDIRLLQQAKRNGTN